MDSADPLIRFVAAVVAAILAFNIGATSVLGLIVLIVAVITVVTAGVGSCPLCKPFAINTGKGSRA